MRTRPFLLVSALAALLLVPAGVTAADPVGPAAVSPAAAFTATITAKANQKSRTVPVKVGATGVPTGKTVTGYWLSENAAPTPTAATAGWKAVPTAFAVSNVQGSHTIYVWAKVKGAISVRGSVTVTLDTVAPTATLAITTTSPTATQTINVTASADPGTGTAIAKYAIVAGTTAPTLGSAWTATPPTTFKVPAGNGLKTVSLFAKDLAGNISAASTQTITLTIPTPTLVLDLKKSYSKSLTVPVGVTTTDPSKTGIKGYYLSTSNSTPAYNAAGWKLVTTNFTFTGGDGTKTLYGWVKDGNNTVSAVSSDTVVIDSTVPVATLTITGSGTANPSFSIAATDANPIVGYALVLGTAAPSANDDLAWSVDSATANSVFTISSGANQTVTAFVLDAAGNVSAVTANSSKTVTKL
ncbi:MAG: hypothetical protein U0869_06645 [Chloroflexota bacterium]